MRLLLVIRFDDDVLALEAPAERLKGREGAVRCWLLVVAKVRVS